MVKIAVISNKSIDDFSPGIKNLIDEKFKGELDEFIIQNNASVEEILSTFIKIVKGNYRKLIIINAPLAFLKVLSCYLCNAEVYVLHRDREKIILF